MTSSRGAFSGMKSEKYNNLNRIIIDGSQRNCYNRAIRNKNCIKINNRKQKGKRS